jgi:glycine dehydrogenase subunit 2
METLFESSRPGRKGYALPELDVPAVDCGSVLEGFCRETAPRLPEMAEVDVVRHFTRLSKLNYSVDEGFYPLGSCTMKYNPKINEAAAPCSPRSPAWTPSPSSPPPAPTESRRG